MFGFGGTTTQLNNTGLYKYEAIPAEIEDYDPNDDSDHQDERRHRPHRRTAFQNCLLFSMPLVLLLIVTWVLVIISSSDRDVSISKSIFKANKKKSETDTTCGTCPSKVLSQDCMSTSSPVLGGLDLVHFYTNTKEGTQGTVYTVGSSSITTIYQSYQFYFQSVENQRLFLQSPETYVPQFGGFCTWGVTGEFCPEYPWSAECLGPSGDWSLGYKYQGKLIFFYKGEAAEKFFANPDYYLEQGYLRWKTWFGNSDGSTKSVYTTNCYVGA